MNRRTDRCETCNFWYDRRTGADAVTQPDSLNGQCRRYPPEQFMPEGDGPTISDWPASNHDAWCGEHQPAGA